MAQSSLKFSTSTPSPLTTLILVLILCILGFYTLHYPLYSSTEAASSRKNGARFHQLFLSSATNDTISSFLRALTLHPHLAGTEPSDDTARYVLARFKDLGLETHSVHYNTLLSYPVRTSLAAHFGNGTVKNFRLADLVQSNPAGKAVVPPYHAYSPSGSAHGEAVFVNYGSDEDYRALSMMGVNVSGCIVVARRGEMPRGVVVERAAANGAVAVLLYTEGESFRNGFERGTVMKGVGDPLSPGWAAVDGAERLNLEDSEVTKRLPKIPSMPLSVNIAEAILQSLGGRPAPPGWRELPLKIAGVGPGPTTLNFTYQGEQKVATIQNVFAVIKGSEEPDRYVLLGNHRDAWTYGAVDPNSGTATLLDIARRFSLLRHHRWSPRRTIILCSWDAEEFGMVGSTEWVEQNVVNLHSKAVAYLNVDCAVQGPGFFSGATPQLDKLLLEVTGQVKDPDLGVTVYEAWASTNSGISIERLSGVNSDFVAFVQHAGVPSIDLYYGKDFPVYHTAFDSYDWMIKHGDPLFQRHVTVANTWGLLALRLADDSILPFNYLSYANQLQVYRDELSIMLDKNISLQSLTTSIQELASAAEEAEREAMKLKEEEEDEDGSDSFVLRKRALNDRLMLAERGFLDVDGLKQRSWFKHLVYGPPSDHNTKMDYFPGVADSISESRKMGKKEAEEVIIHEVWRVSRAIQRAASVLRGVLT